MKLFVNAVGRIMDLSKRGLASEAIAARVGVPREAVLAVLKAGGNLRGVRNNDLVEIPGTSAGPRWCSGCGGLIAALPCLKCQCEGRRAPVRRVTPRLLATRDAGGIREVNEVHVA
jgi:hypothetical protein